MFPTRARPEGAQARAAFARPPAFAGTAAEAGGERSAAAEARVPVHRERAGGLAHHRRRVASARPLRPVHRCHRGARRGEPFDGQERDPARARARSGVGRGAARLGVPKRQQRGSRDRAGVAAVARARPPSDGEKKTGTDNKLKGKEESFDEVARSAWQWPGWRGWRGRGL